MRETTNDGRIAVQSVGSGAWGAKTKLCSQNLSSSAELPPFSGQLSKGCAAPAGSFYASFLSSLKCDLSFSLKGMKDFQ